MNTRLPNFLIAGAAKAGTSSLHYHLKGHPEVFMPLVKEPCFFSGQFLALPQRGPGDATKIHVRNFDDYASLFDGSSGAKAVGEASVDTLYYHANTIPAIRRLLGDPAIIIALRNPVDRAYSAYFHLRRDNREHLSFEGSLREEPGRIANNWQAMWHHKARSLYYPQVKAFREAFSRVHIILLDDLSADPAGVIRQMYGFLGIDPDHTPHDIDRHYNPTGIPKHPAINRLFLVKNPAQRVFRRLACTILTEKRWAAVRDTLRQRVLTRPAMNLETRIRLQGEFADDIRQLQDLVGRDLSRWLSPTVPAHRGSYA